MRTVYIVQHVEPEGPGRIAEALDAHGVPYHRIAVFEGQEVPTALPDAAAIVSMGGPMGVGDASHLAWMRREMELMRWALQHGTPVLGVCLGSQLLAAAAGASVHPGDGLEVGWHRVQCTAEAAGDPLFGRLPPSFDAFHWHGDVFDLPPGAVGLARSARTAHQAFRLGESAWGILFHLEVDEASVATMLDTFADDVVAAGERAADIAQAAPAKVAAMAPLANIVFGAFAVLAARRLDGRE